jgi:hypothetical protein
MTVPSDLPDDPTGGVRRGYAFDCGYHDCRKSFSGDDLQRICSRAATHLNKEHGDDLRHGYDPIDEVVIGGHHIQGHSYEVRKYTVYVTAFDVFEELGALDGLLVAGENACDRCLCRISTTDDEARIEDEPDDPFNDDWTCATCVEEQRIEQRATANNQLEDFA